MKVLIYSTHGFDKSFIEKEAQGKHELFFSEDPLNESTVYLAKGFDAVALFTSDIASEKVLEKLHDFGVKYIALRSVGYDHVAISKAKDLGIKVANVPAYSPYAIAEHAVTLLLCLNRKILHGQKLMKTNDFRLDHLVGFDLHGKTIAVIGTGKIGSAFARIMKGFGCEIIAYDVNENLELKHEINLKYHTLDFICENADVISVCCPLNEKTKYMFDKSTFSKMKKGVMFINTARGGIVNTVDLIEALETGIISGAGLDVYENEKPIFFNDLRTKSIDDNVFQKLRSFENVLITGHQAFLTNEALIGIAKTTIENLNEWEISGESKNDVN